MKEEALFQNTYLGKNKIMNVGPDTKNDCTDEV
jgi:hypothetical protein